jgi:hypothetical protein
MATFIPNITEVYKPPTQLPLNIDRVERMLKMREALYQDGAKKVRSLYESAFNSPMLRDGNIKRRDEYLKLINDGLKNVSGMDLSLAQNQNIAANMFQPVLEDENIVKDIAFTRNYQKEVSKAEGLRNSSNAEDRKRYWDTGVKYMQYKAEEFKNADEQTALGMSAPKFVENVDLLTYAQEMFKDSGISVKQDQVSGGYIYTKKNGDVVYPVTQEYVATLFNQDPAIKQMLQAQSYVKRKDFVKQNALTYGGEQQSEIAYLTNAVKDQVQNAQDELAANEKTLQQSRNELHAISQMLKKNGVKDVESSESYLQAKEKIAQYEAVIQQKRQHLLNNTQINYNSMDDLRFAVDNANTYNSYSGIVQDVAKMLSYKDSEFTMKADPYAMEKYQAELNLKNQMIMENIRQANRIALDWQQALNDIQADKLRKEMGLSPTTGRGGRGGSTTETAEEKKERLKREIEEKNEEEQRMGAD